MLISHNIKEIYPVNTSEIVPNLVVPELKTGSDLKSKSLFIYINEQVLVDESPGNGMVDRVLSIICSKSKPINVFTKDEKFLAQDIITFTTPKKELVAINIYTSTCTSCGTLNTELYTLPVIPDMFNNTLFYQRNDDIFIIHKLLSLQEDFETSKGILLGKLYDYLWLPSNES